MAKNTFILSVGGSLIVPEDVDSNFLKKFKVFIESEVKKGNRFIIITGGGKTARRYQTALRAVQKNLSQTDSDWMGIAATHVNAMLVSKVLGKIAYLKKDFNPETKEKYSQPVMVSAGYEPGWSTDYDSVVVARNYGAKTIINLSNIEYVYDKDPKLPGAKKIEKMSWTQMRKIVGSKWTPGLNAPFDPIASKFAQANNLRVIVMNGKDLKNLSAALNGKKFKGTIIEGK